MVWTAGCASKTSSKSQREDPKPPESAFRAFVDEADPVEPQVVVQKKMKNLNVELIVRGLRQRGFVFSF